MAAGGSQGEKIQVMDVNIPFPMGFGVPGVQDIHLIELFGAFGTIFQHGSHSGVPVDIGIFPLDISILRGFEGQILIDFHQAGVHFAVTGALRPIKDIFFGGAGMSIFN